MNESRLSIYFIHAIFYSVSSYPCHVIFSIFMINSLSSSFQLLLQTNSHMFTMYYMKKSHFSYGKWPTIRIDCTSTVRWELWRSLSAICRSRDRLQLIVKKHNFSWSVTSLMSDCWSVCHNFQKGEKKIHFPAAIRTLVCIIVRAGPLGIAVIAEDDSVDDAKHSKHQV